LTKKQAKKLIWQYGDEILRSKGMALEKRFLQHGKVTVFEHSVAVAVLCLQIADRLSVKVDSASFIKGALLHDYFLYDWHIPDKSHRLHGFTHAKCACRNAERDFKLNEIERNMICSHMFPLTPTLPKYRESVILCIADKICAVQETLSGLRNKKK
jgi:HDIG domain protein